MLEIIQAIVLTNAFVLGMFVRNAGLVEERDEGLVGGLDEQELKRVSVECDALKRGNDCVKECAACNYQICI